MLGLTTLGSVLFFAGLGLEILLGTLIAYRAARVNRARVSGGAMSTAVFAVVYWVTLVTTNEYPGVQIGIAVASIALMCWINYKLAISHNR